MVKRFKNSKNKSLLIFFFVITGITFFFWHVLNKVYQSVTTEDQSLVVSLLLKDNLESLNLNNLNELKNPVFLVKYNLTKKILPKTNVNEEPTAETLANNNYLVYIYNTHQGEEYLNTSLEPFNITPNVMTSSYILKEYLHNNGLESLVEEGSVKDILNANNWHYGSSYKASRLLLTSAKDKYPTLNYFIDIHRDSSSKNITTTTIKDKKYAKVLFIIGLENSNYALNEEFAQNIEKQIKNYDSSLSRGILEKKGVGVNGIYNEDFSSHTILIEIGGQDNTLEEVNNTMKVLADALSEVIKNGQ